MQDKTWYSILGLDAEPLFLQDDMLRVIFDQWPKLHLGLDARSNQKILNGI
jgi:hypothetical protein